MIDLKKYNLVSFLKIAIVLVFFGSVFFSTKVALAGSCNCVNDCSTVQAPICQKNVTKAECDSQNKRFKVADEICNISCQYFSDNQCQNSSEDSADPFLAFNKCWTEAGCKAAGGEPAPVADSPDCKPLGDTPTVRCLIKSPTIPLQIAIPGVTEKACSILNEHSSAELCSQDSDCQAKNLGFCRPAIAGGFPGYIQKFSKFFITFLAVCAVIMVMWGGFKRIIAAGNAERIGDANDAIFSALIGLVLALLSYTLLNLINPVLVENSGLKIDKIKTQSTGDWCPDPDPNDPNRRISCGEWSNVNGNQCRGSSCAPQLGYAEGLGCYPVDVVDETVGYKCTQPWAACASINDDNVEDIHGKVGGSHDVYTSACALYSDKNGSCLWMETSNLGTTLTIGGLTLLTVATGGAGTAIAIPAIVGASTVTAGAALAVGGTAGNLLSSDDRCAYLSNDFVKAVCTGGQFNGQQMPTLNDCGDFEDSIGELDGVDWPFCYYNLCKPYNPNLNNCHADWSTSTQRWSCEPDLDR